jgi:hypothetical protein
MIYLFIANLLFASLLFAFLIYLYFKQDKDYKHLVGNVKQIESNIFFYIDQQIKEKLQK